MVLEKLWRGKALDRPPTRDSVQAPDRLGTAERQAYGFRDREFFKLKILAIHETKYELVG